MHHPSRPRLWALRPRRTELLPLLLFFAAHLAACGVAQWLAIVPGTGISLWIPGGIYLAALLVSRPGLWPACMLMAAGAELLANGLWFRNTPGVAVALHLGNALGAACGALLVQRITRQRRFRLETLPDVLTLLVGGAALAPVLSALVGALTLHAALGQNLQQALLLWWLGDATGAMIGAPLVLIAVQGRRPWLRPSAPRLLEALALCGVLLALSAVSLGGQLPFAYVVTPVLVWAAVSFQFLGAAVAILVLTLMTAYFTSTGRSPFVGTVSTQAWHAMMLQLFLAVSAILGLCVAAVSRQHQRAVLALQAANADLEARVGQRTAQLQQAARHKDVLMATIAHELRTPLSAIATGGEVLKRLASPPEPVQAVQQLVERQCRLLARLVDDLMDAAAINEGKLTLQRACVDITGVVSQALQSCRPQLDAKGHRVDAVLPAAPLWVHGDAGRLLQCVCNLLDNAGKYTPAQGRISVALSQVAEPTGPMALLQISDNGIGIDSAGSAKVFEMFYQAHTAPGGGGLTPGLGLGLGLVKRLVNLHGGAVGVHSAGLGQGSTFWLKLPLVAAPAGSAQAVPEQPAQAPGAAPPHLARPPAVRGVGENGR